jgi:nucleotide-binding universal stress UspA family protein
MYHSILVPLDGSPVSEQALPVAYDLARRSGALLRLVHVHVGYTAAPIYVEGIPVVDEQLHSLAKAHALAYLERVRDRLVDEGEADLRVAPVVLDPAEAVIRDQTVPEMLARYAATTDTDLIVMTTHGRGRLARFWLGSVADALVHTSSVPILLVRPDGDTAPVEHPPAFRQILIALDGSAAAEQLLAPARTLGDMTQAAYTLLQVVEPHTLLRSGPFTTPTDFDAEDTQRRMAEAQRYLEGIAQALRSDGVAVRVDVRVAEQVAAAILDAAADQHVDLVAIATHGQSGIARLLLGSVADKVVRGARLPVLLYRPQAPYERSDVS